MTGDIKKVSAGGKGGMSAAISGTEAIRNWDEHKCGTAELCKRFETNKDAGLTGSQAN